MKADDDTGPLRRRSSNVSRTIELSTLRLLLHGPDKREAAVRVLALDAFDPGWPASIVHDHADAEIWVDHEALP